MTTAIYPSLVNKTVVITGGGSGIGAEIVRGFVRQKSRVFFLDIAEKDSRALVEQLGGAPTFLKCDLTKISELQAALADIQQQAGPVSVLVNNAANDDRHRIEDVTEDYWNDRIAVNLRHYFFAAQAVMPAMRKARSGCIVNLGSVSWHLAMADLALYETAKAGIEGMTRALARELGESAIRVTCVIPGAVRTPRQMALWHTPDEEAKIVAQQCIKARVEPQDIAAMVMFLASDDARYCTNHSYWVDAGYR
ncbi:MAG TPA: SDR family oxidoreductase [Vicinamibacterales bacterium]|jgi:NAD(P)-dependent dehydrogenase (short-subunit alcohol dehydrogenase family)|nr:SDR family oxidoreductase [Steroidobacteraceae bacterium]HVZ19890.1 SDR family oxidoreductase [Vicinamibacterales bacterium]